MNERTTIRMNGWSLHKQGSTYVYGLMNEDRKNFGRPVKAKARKGKRSEWRKKDRRRKKRQNKNKNI